MMQRISLTSTRWPRICLLLWLITLAPGCSDNTPVNLRTIRDNIASDQQLTSKMVSENQNAQRKLNNLAREIQGLRDEVLLSEQQLNQLTQLTDSDTKTNSEETNRNEAEKLKRRLLQANLEKAKTTTAITAEKDGIPYIIRQIQEQLRTSLTFIDDESKQQALPGNISDISSYKRQIGEQIASLREYMQKISTVTYKLNKVRDTLKYRVSDIQLRIDPARKRLQKLQKTEPVAASTATSDSTPPPSTPAPAP